MQIKRENEEEEERHNFNNTNDEKRTNTALLFKRTRIWTHRWIYERFVSYEPLLCFTCVIFVQNEALIWWEKIDFFFWKKDERFLCVSSLGATVLGSRGFWRRKKWKRHLWLLLVASTPPPRPRVLAVFAEENSWSRSLKKEQKNECVWLFPLLYRTRESGTRIPQSALRFVLRII